MPNPKEHFNEIAKDYDYWKSKNWYYYQNLKALYRSLVPKQSRVWEIGCGTGDILASLEPSSGYGTDTSEGMIGLANQKYGQSKNLAFGTKDIEQVSEKFDYVIMADVLEHVEGLDSFFSRLAGVTGSGTKVIISVANPLWEPLLMLAEKLNMKMPEGPHWRLSLKKNEAIFKKNGFKVVDKNYRLLIPKKIPLSDWINVRFYKFKILASLGFVIYWILEK